MFSSQQKRRSSRVSVCTAAVAVAATSALVLATGSAQGEPEGRGKGEPATQITVDVTQGAGQISPLLFSANHRYGDAGLDTLDPSTGEVDQQFAQEVGDAGVAAVRFPAGTQANLYRWKRAIGNVEERGRNPSGNSNVFGPPFSNEYGVDEHARFVEDIGGETSIVVNFATGTAAEAADWVEYMNAPVGTNPNGGVAWAQVRADNGHPEPYGVTYWEVGNEVQQHWQSYWMGGDEPNTRPVSEYAELYAFGGSMPYTDQPVAKGADFRSSAAQSDGSPGQKFLAKYAPVKPGTDTVKVAGEPWTRVDNLSQAGPKDVYTLDPATGAIQFGDGQNGNVPPASSAITISYESGPHDGFVDYYEAMKAADPDIKVCSGFGYEDDENGAFDAIFRIMGAEHPYDCTALHPYASPRFVTDEWAGLSHDEIHDQAMLAPAGRAEVVRKTQELVERYAGDRNPEVAITEYGMWISDSLNGPDYFGQTLTAALYTALSLIEFQDLGINLAEKHSLFQATLDSTYGGSTLFTGTTSQPAAHVMRLLSPLAGSEQVAANIEGNPTRVISDGQELSALVSLAGRDDEGRVRLVVINRDRQSDVTASIAVNGSAHTGTATVRTLNGPGYASYNSPENPDVVSIEDSTIPWPAGGASRTFPANSVTEISLPSRGKGNPR